MVLVLSKMVHVVDIPSNRCTVATPLNTCPCPRSEVPLWKKLLLTEIIVVATICGVASTYEAVKDIIDDTLESSCLIDVSDSVATALSWS